MRTIILPLAALSLLAACGEGEPSKPVAMNDVVSEAKQLNKPVPGLYRSSTRLLELNIPGMPPSMAAQMREKMSAVQSQTNEFCLTAAEVDKGWEDMAKNMNNASKDATCEFSKFNADGGNLDALMTCKANAGMMSNIAMTGTMKPEKQIMKMVITQSGGPAKMNMTMEVTNDRVGDCPKAG